MKKSLFCTMLMVIAIFVFVPSMSQGSVYGSSEGIPLNEETFPYHNFRWKIEREVDLNKDSILSDEEISSYTEIELEKMNAEDIVGITYLTSLKTVTFKEGCSSYGLPSLPSSVETIYCESSRYTGLFNFPSGLKHLTITSPYVITIEGLPEGLETFYCSSIRLESISNLPESLVSFTCKYGYLKELPPLPEGIVELDLEKNLIHNILDCENLSKLTTLNISKNYIEEVYLHPDCPLSSLNVEQNQLTSKADVKGKEITWDGNNFKYGTQRKPIIVKVDENNFPDEVFRNFVEVTYDKSLPSGALTANEVKDVRNIKIEGLEVTSLKGIEYFPDLRSLTCQNGKLKSLPALPENLQELYCNGNQLTFLPELPDSLVELSASNNQLTELPKLPAKLAELGVGGNRLTSLPELPDSLLILACSNNQLTELPKLPSKLASLSCGGNQLTKLPTLPKTIDLLNCNSNQLKRLPTLPARLENLNCSNNQIEGVLDLRKQEELQRIQCDGNRITAVLLLDERGTDPKTYELIDVSNNYISDASYVYGNDTFKWNGKKYIYGTQKGTDCIYGKGTVTKTANFSRFGEQKVICSQCGEVVYKPIPMIAKVKLSYTTTPYTGKKKSGPKVTLIDVMGKTISKTNYTVTYGTGRKAIGKYKVEIKGKNLYGSSKSTKYFKIVPKETKIKSISGTSTSITVKWAKQTTQTTGYQISYGISTTADNGTKILISNNKTTSKKIKNLKPKKKYTVWIRTYKVQNGTKYYSPWSEKKIIRT